MFAGHYAPAFVLAGPRAPLWRLFLAAQAVDIAFFALVPLGVESLTIDPSKGGNLALVLEWMPWSHSLVAAIAWGVVLGLLTRCWQIGVVTTSHWFLDLFMHGPDLPLAGGDGVRVGFGLWSMPMVAWGFELLVLAVGIAVYARRHGSRHAVYVGLTLMLVQTLQSFVIPVPTSTMAVAALSQASYLGFAGWVWWGGRRGRATGDGTSAA